MRFMRSRRRWFGRTFGACALALVGMLYAFPSAAAEVVKIGTVVPWPSYSMFQLAVHEHLVPTKYRLEITNFSDPLTAYNMLATGRVDILLGTGDYIAVATSKGLPISEVAMDDVSYGTDQIVAKKSIKTAQDLAGKRIAAPQAYIGELLMEMWLEKIGAKPTEVKWVDLNAPDAVGPMLSGTLAAAYMYNPWISKVLDHMPDVHVVATSAEPYYLKQGVLIDTVYMNTAFIKHHRAAALAMLKVRYNAVQYWHDHTAAANQYIAKTLKWPVSDVEQIIGTNGKFVKGGLYLFSFDDTARYCGVLPGNPPVGLKNGGWPAGIERTAELWVAVGLLHSVEKDVARGLDCSLVNDLVKSGYRQAMSARK